VDRARGGLQALQIPHSEFHVNRFVPRMELCLDPHLNAYGQKKLGVHILEQLDL